MIPRQNGSLLGTLCTGVNDYSRHTDEETEPGLIVAETLS